MYYAVICSVGMAQISDLRERTLNFQKLSVIADDTCVVTNAVNELEVSKDKIWGPNVSILAMHNSSARFTARRNHLLVTKDKILPIHENRNARWEHCYFAPMESKR